MAAVTVELVGADKAVEAFAKMDGVVRQRVRDAINITALNIDREAKKLCPVNFGRLRAAIRPVFTNDGTGIAATVGTRDVDYAAHIEFGTRPHMPPPGVLLLWMKRKGIPEEAEWAIRMKIAREGTRPQPFLFPAFEAERPEFFRRMEKAVRG